MDDLVYIDDYGLLGSEYYWNNHEKMNITKDELLAIGMQDGRVQVHKDLIAGLQTADKAFQEKGMRLYLKEGYRSNALYELAFRKRTERFGEQQTRQLMNIDDRPHATGRAVDVAPWEPKENKEIFTRNKKDDPQAIFIDFYKGKEDAESKRYQELQEFTIATMLANGFEIGKLREYFHFNYGNSFKVQLEKEGFLHVYEWKDAPNTEYPSHKHQGKVTLYIVDGGLTFHIDGEIIDLKRGDRFDVPVGKEHTAKVSLKGCSYIVGEMIEGDS